MWNRQIELTESQWRGHILTNHPELQGHLDAIRMAIEQPDTVTYDAHERRRENFYVSSIKGRLLLKVCVHYREQSEQLPRFGFVVTAYFIGRVPPKEGVRWSSTT